MQNEQQTFYSSKIVNDEYLKNHKTEIKVKKANKFNDKSEQNCTIILLRTFFK